MPRTRRLKTTGSEAEVPVVKKIGRPIKANKLDPKKLYISKTGVNLESCYCRKCMRTKIPKDFYDAVDNGLIDANGKFSVCKECCNDIYQNFFDNYKSVEKAILKTCRVLNIRYDEVAFAGAVNQLTKRMEVGGDYKTFFGVYKAYLMKTQATRITDRDTNEDFTFVEPSIAIVANPLDDSVEEAEDLRMTWGENLEYDDYRWLENELAEWKKTHKSDTKAEETLLKEICYKGLEIRNARRDGKSPGSLVKEYQELMKTANVDPAKSAIAGSGKSQDTFSSFIKTIEENEPAEYYQDKGLFKDFGNLDQYFKRFLTRPLKNFLKIGPPDFNVSEDSGTDEEYEDIDIADVLKDTE